MKFFVTLGKVFITVIACAAIAISAAYFMANAKYYTPEKRLVAKATRAEFQHYHPTCTHYKKDGVEYWNCDKCGAWMTIIKNTISGEHGNHPCDAVVRKNNLYKEEKEMGMRECLELALDPDRTPHHWINPNDPIDLYCERCGLHIYKEEGGGTTINRIDFNRDVRYCHK